MIYGVAGATRSGTTLCMAMLHAGGLSVYADNLVAFETEDIKRLPWDATWLAAAEGKAVKFLDPLHWCPPSDADMKLILTTRDSRQQAKSMAKLLGMRLSRAARRELAADIARDTALTIRRFRRQYDTLIVRFEDLVGDPHVTASRIAGFFGLDPGNVPAMEGLVIPRGPRCLPGLLEGALLERSLGAPRAAVP